MLNADTNPPLASFVAGSMTKEQLGHLQHIHNLASLPDGEWRHMGPQDPGQEWLDAYRYQIAFMAYSLGLTAYHRLPAAPLTLQPTFDRLIQKMLRREVWAYWKDTSRSGPHVDPGLEELREGWIDPVIRENIMYSGHLHAMVGMYRMLFGDDKYDASGSLSFNYDPIFYGLGPETFAYDHASLNDAVYRQFAQHNWLGIPREPNNVFVVCNQYPILGFRFFDAVHGTHRSDEVVAKYSEAWSKRNGFLGEGNSIVWSLMERQDHLIKSQLPSSAWTLGALNCWNPAVARSVHDRQTQLWLKPASDGTVQVRSAPEIMAMEAGQPAPSANTQWGSPDFGYVALWLSEMGDQSNLAGVLAHADQFMQPIWENGGLFYPRHDDSYDADNRLTYMDPLSGNALIGYSRLNVADGMRALFENPWTAKDLKRPQITEVIGTDLLRAVYSRPGEITFDMAAASANSKIELVVSGISKNSSWSVQSGESRLATSSMPQTHAVEETSDNKLRIFLDHPNQQSFSLAWKAV